MSLTALMLLAAQVEAEVPLIPAFFTGETLHGICSRPNRGLCSMYVAGVVDGLFYARSRGGMGDLCPAALNNREAAQVVTTYLAANPDRRPKAAALVVREALTERLSCANGRNAPGNTTSSGR